MSRLDCMLSMLCSIASVSPGSTKLWVLSGLPIIVAESCRIYISEIRASHFVSRCLDQKQNPCCHKNGDTNRPRDARRLDPRVRGLTTTMWGWVGRCRWLILDEKSLEECSSGFEARDERMLSWEDFLLRGAPMEGLRLVRSSSALLCNLTGGGGGLYSDLPSSETGSS